MKLLSEHQSRILELLKANSQMSVDELVGELGLAKTAVRRQLLAMERRGLIEREFRAASRGRPTLAFALTSDAKRLFPSKEAELLSDLMNFLNREGHDEILDRFFESYWQKRLDLIMERIRKTGRDDLETRLEVLKEVLEDEGFMPSARFEQKGRELLLRECHCPIEAAVKVSALPCRLEQRLIAKVLNAPVTSALIRGETRSSCEFRLPVSKLTRK